MAFAIVVPPLQVTDEHAHFIRAYLVSRGEFVGRPLPELPADIVAFVMRYPEKAELIRRLSPQEIVRDLPVRASDPAGSAAIANDSQHHYLVSGVIATSLYFPIVYLPASAGIWMARTLHMSPLVMMYAARMCNVFTLVVALAVSFRLAPRCRALMTAIALMPMTLHQAGAISADLVTIAFSFVGLSLVLYARERFVSRRFLMVVAVVFALWGLCKSSIWALPLLLLIPSSAFKSRRAWLVYIGAASICMVGALLIWNGMTAANMAAVRAERLSEGIDIPANVRLAAAHPLAFARYLVAWVTSYRARELGKFVGAFGWTMFSLPYWLRSLYLLLVVIVAAAEPSVKRFLAWERGVLLLVFLGGAVFVHVAMALSDTTLCGDLSTGCFLDFFAVQGRYLIPFCLCGLLTLRQSRVTLPQVTLLAAVDGFGTLHALAALALIRSHFYL
jgi:uncharacterized membrane protein